MEMKKLVKGLAVAGLFAVSANTFAATADGALGATSTGTVDINVDVGTQVRITGLQPMTGNFYVSGDVTDSTTACIYRNSGADYEITATSSNGSGTDFFLDDGAGTTDDVLYDVSFNDGSGAVDLNNGTTDSTFTGANTTSETCGGSANATISITVFEAGANGLAAAPSGLYTDELSIEVAPR